VPTRKSGGLVVPLQRDDAAQVVKLERQRFHFGCRDVVNPDLADPVAVVVIGGDVFVDIDCVQDIVGFLPEPEAWAGGEGAGGHGFTS
jgi:hypothetical protein